MRHSILCIIANDAAPGDDKRNVYTGVGLNFTQRVQDAVVWGEENIPYNHSIIWMFGAGTDLQHADGPTLAEQCRDYVKKLLPHTVTLTNVRGKNYYGTLEEMSWIVMRAEEELVPAEVEFVFFTQKRHMRRVKLIWRLFFEAKWGKATFVTTRHVRQISLTREFFARRKVWRVYHGKELPRYATPYPTVGRSKIEC